jgi:streptomycin 6-kinase
MNLPHRFGRSVRAAFGERGRAFLEGLPELISRAQQRWNLDGIRPADSLSYNFVAFARRGGQDVVLKLGVPNRELTSEIAALRHFDGRGAVRLLEADASAGMLLLERLRPGHMLVSIADDAEATAIAADVMIALHHPAAPDSDLIDMQSWFDAFKRLRARFHGAVGPLDGGLVQLAENIVVARLEDEYEPVLLHGDLHHFNILSSARGWLAIDPKGVIGPAAYEVGAFLINPWVVTGRRADTRRLLLNRGAVRSEHLGFDGQTIRDWGVVHAVLSACWSLEEGQDWMPSMQCAADLAATSGDFAAFKEGND